MDTALPQPTGLDALSARARAALAAVLLLVLSMALILQCWRAPFNGYDDPAHVAEHPLVQRDGVTWRELITPPKGETYFPVTLLSYRIDRALFGGWMPEKYGTWAPGARITNMLYHALAAFVLWRLLLALRLSTGIALFVAAAFAAHPMACESVAWLSERKNVLAALFGFLSLLAWVKGEIKIWRVPVTLTLWVLALLSKPNALGLLPIFAIYDLCGGVNGLHGDAPMNWRAPRAWIGIFERLIWFVVPALLVIRVNLRGFESVILPPPGGSLFTALLTDVEIVTRYVLNTLLPLWLSASYLVLPITSLTDPRLWLYGVMLAALIAASLYFASNRRLALFAWLWVFGALGTHLNFKSLTYLMQDRYFYLSSPGLLLLVALVAKGLAARITLPRRALLIAGSALVLSFAVLAGLRSVVWNNMFTLFSDAVAKQPFAAYGHFGAAQAVREKMFIYSQYPNPDPARLKTLEDGWYAQLLFAADCPDAARIPDYLHLLKQIGDMSAERGDLVRAETYYRRGLTRSPETLPSPVAQADCLRGLARIRFHEGKADAALAELDKAMALYPSDPARVERGTIALQLAKARRTAGMDVAALLSTARGDLEQAAKNPQTEKEARSQLDELRRLEAP